MSDPARRSAQSSKMMVLGLLLCVILPIAAVAGWLYWGASATRPWMQGTGAIIILFLLTGRLLDFGLLRSGRLSQLTGDGAFRQTVSKSITLYLPLVLIVGLNDLDHARSLRSNLTEYVVTIIAAVGVLICLELAWTACARLWAAYRPYQAGKH